MAAVIEPKAEEFFASADGVCVYVRVGQQAVRFQFASPDGPGTVQGAPDVATDEALAVATSALSKHQEELQPLFDRIAAELAARRG
jgi:hypothetical protein